MSRTDIKKLQQEGRLEEALAMAMEQYVQSPDALWAKADLAWTYDAVCKKAATEGNIEAFEQAYQPIAKLGILATNQTLSDTLCWRFRSIMATCSARMEAAAKPAFAQRIWEMAHSLGDMHPSEACSVLCKTFYQLRDNWSGFVDFMDWWGWETFRPEDYLQEKLPNGKLMPLSLAEGCYIAYAKLLLQIGDRDRILRFLPRLESLSEAYPAMLYPGYYTGKLLISIGGDKQSMLQSVLPFVRRKSGEFWAWQLLAEVMRDDESLYISCLLRAVYCKTQDSFLVKVLYLLTTLCLSRRDYAAAQFFLQRYVAAKTAAQSRMPAEVYHWTDEPWYRANRIDKSVSPILQMDYLDITDKLLYADIPERPVCVVRYMPETRMATVVFGYEKRGFVKLPKSKKSVEYGTILMVRLQQAYNTGEKLSTYTIRKSRWEELPSSQFLREVEGKITSNKSKTVFFVQFGREYAFVPNELYKKQALVVGERMLARIIWDYQKNKECWSWRCISIKEKTK